MKKKITATHIANNINIIWQLFHYVSRKESQVDLRNQVAKLSMDLNGKDYDLAVCQIFGAVVNLMNCEGITMEDAVDSLEKFFYEHKHVYETTSRRMDAGLFTGSFNMVTNGHVGPGLDLLRGGYLDELHYIVSNDHPEKSDQASSAHRLEMLKIACSVDSRLKPSDVEIRFKSKGYTNFLSRLIKVLDEFKESNNFIVFGADVALRYPKWPKSNIQMNFVKTIVLPRLGYDLKFSHWYNNPPNFRVIDQDIRETDISSSKVRNLIKEGKNAQAKKLVHPQVFEYFMDHKLYHTKN